MADIKLNELTEVNDPSHVYSEKNGQQYKTPANAIGAASLKTLPASNSAAYVYGEDDGGNQSKVSIADIGKLITGGHVIASSGDAPWGIYSGTYGLKFQCDAGAIFAVAFQCSGYTTKLHIVSTDFTINGNIAVSSLVPNANYLHYKFEDDFIYLSPNYGGGVMALIPILGNVTYLGAVPTSTEGWQQQP